MLIISTEVCCEKNQYRRISRHRLFKMPTTKCRLCFAGWRVGRARRRAGGVGSGRAHNRPLVGAHRPRRFRRRERGVQRNGAAAARVWGQLCQIPPHATPPLAPHLVSCSAAAAPEPGQKWRRDKIKLFVKLNRTKN